MANLSQNKRKIIEQTLQNAHKPVPQQVKRLIQRTRHQTILLDEKFKNLQDPLNYIRTRKAQQTSNNLHRQMDEISDFSKLTYKKIISRQNTQFNFQRLEESIFKNNPIVSETELDWNKFRMKKQQQRIARSKSKHLNIQGKHLGGNNFYDNTIKSKQKPTPKNYNHKMQTFQEIKQISKNQLNFKHIKLIDTPQFDKQCKQVQFYELLKSDKSQYHKFYNQPFDIDNNKPIQKAMNLLNFNPIQFSSDFSSDSKNLFFNFDQNLKFWKQKNIAPSKINNEELQKSKRKDQQILSFCYKFNRKVVTANNLYDFAMRNITVDMIQPYFQIKHDHELRLLTDKKNQNLDQMYEKLKKQFQFAKQMRMKSKTQRLPTKPVDCQSQTIQKMQQKQFDQYFCEDTNLLLQKLGKLNEIRERYMTKKNEDKKFIMVKNVCLDINQLLFKLLIMMIKGQKFYPKYDQNTKQNIRKVPYFTYSDLLNQQNKDQVQKKILQLIYTRLNQFQVQFIDGISKAKIISIYVQERQKNNKILQILYG